jgi:hypothetical protein
MRWEGFADDVLIACHYFASDYYRGEHSQLYQAICAIGYDGKGMTLTTEPDGVCLCYEALERLYAMP